MNIVDTSHHICLICNQTVIGLLQYVEHFKSHATPQECHLVEQKVDPFVVNDVKTNNLSDQRKDSNDTTDSRNIKQSPPHSSRRSSTQVNENSIFNGGPSPLSEFHGDFADPDLHTDAFLSPKHCPDFFQSLELKSTNEEVRPKPKIKAVQRLSILEDDLHAESLLPITTILSNLDFSSDDESVKEFREYCEGGDGMGSWSDEEDSVSSRNPPSGHTGGKWKPGEGPKRKMAIAGKWRPRQRPGPACRKKIMRHSGKGRGPRADKGKVFHCNVCNTHFDDRTSFSLHFSQDVHKGLVAKKNQDKISASSVEDKSVETDDNSLSQKWTECSTENALSQPVEQLSSQSLIHQSPHIVEPTHVGSLNQSQGHSSVPVSSDLHNEPLMEQPVTLTGKKSTENHHCSVCDLYFSNDVVYKTHCETKVHKEGLLKQGFREFRSDNGNVIRVNIHSETVYIDKGETRGTDKEHDARKESLYLIENETHECNICKKSFKRKYEMARHLLTRMHKTRAQSQPQDQWVENLHKYNKYMMRLSPFQCGICQFYFNRQRDFLDHMCSSSHVQNCSDMFGPVICVSCKFKTHEHGQMMEHLQRPEHFAAVEKHHRMCIVRESHTRVTCKFCGVKMHSTVRMKRHHERRHADRVTEVQEALKVKPVEYNMHPCPVCQKAFRAKTMLQLHFLKAHRKQAVFNCKICGRGFLDQRRLDNHLRTRYHAKRVIAAKLGSEGQENKNTSGKDLRGQLPMEKRPSSSSSHKPRRETASEDSEKKHTAVNELKLPPENDKSQETVGHDEQVTTTRRSSRKRKKVEFFDEIQEDPEKDESDHLKAKRNRNKTNVNKEKGLLKIKIGLKSKTVIFKTQASDEESNLQEKALKPSGKHKSESLKSQKSDSPDQNDITGNNQERVAKEMTEKEENLGEEKVLLKKDANETMKKEVVDVDDETLLEASKHIFSCIYCEFAASDLIELRKHYNEFHPNEILTCQPCNQYFLSLKAYKIHCSGRGHQLKLREQSGETIMHKCPVCDKRFLQESCCALHVETVHRHPSSEADLQRIHKGQDLVTQLYGDHIGQVENLSNDSSVSCPECGKFVRKDTLVEHLRLHTGERPYACRFCPKSFAGRLTLRRHISSHLNMPLFMCDTCGKEFKRNTHLVKHIRQHEFEKKGEKHTCHVCKVWFYTPEELERHMKRHGERTFKCTWPGCQWTFVLSGELKSHMFTHTKEKKYLCDMCGFGAPTKTRLRRHSRIHDKSRSFKCDYCPYKATCKTHLKRHMRIHINSKPFACPYCNYVCNTHENIRKHILKTQKHKGMKLYPCKLCSEFGCDSSREFKAHLMTVHADYLRKNAVDSLAVFSGLYKREEDLQSPKEGAEILQVTKGRFFRNYQNPDAPQSKPAKPKKVKKPPQNSQKMGEVKVVIVPPSELESGSASHQRLVEQQSHLLSNFEEEGPQQPQERQHLQDPQKIIVDLQGQEPPPPPQQHHHHLQHQQQDTLQPQPQDGQMENMISDEQTPQYITVPNLVIQASYVPQTEDLPPNPVALPSNSVEQHQEQQQHSYAQEHIPTSLTISDTDKVYWAVEFPDPRLDVSTPTSAATPEPWYSGMPQVHAPTTQELSHYRPVENSTAQANFLPNTYFRCTLPTGQIYTSAENTLVVLEDTSHSINNNNNNNDNNSNNNDNSSSL